MVLSNSFQNSVLFAIKEREARALEVIAGVEQFLDKAIELHKANPIQNIYVDKYEKREDSIEQDDYQTVIYQTYKSGKADPSTILEISVYSSGKVSVYCAGNEFGNVRDENIAIAVAKINETEPRIENSESRQFDFDDYKPEEAVAKILTVIQDVGFADFGNLITHTLNRLLITSVMSETSSPQRSIDLRKN